MTSRKTRKLPESADGVVSRDLGGEYVVLNTATEEAHALQGPAAVVWRSVCDGTSPELPDEQVEEAVQALETLGLLLPPAGMTRRSMLKTGGVIAATGIGIVTIGLPEVAAASSQGTQAITLAPTSGIVGSTVLVSGTKFAANSTALTATFNATAITFTNSGTDATGTINTGASFTVPTLPHGTYAFIVTDDKGNTATATFTIDPSITLNPTSGSNNNNHTVTVTGSGFAASKTLTLTFAGTGETFTNGTSTATGTITTNAHFTTPLTSNGSKTVTVSDGTNSASATWTAT
jgi:hypothetical protein